MIRTRPTSIIDRIVAWSFNRPLSISVQCLLTTVVIVAVAIGRVLFVPDTLPWLLFIPSSIGIALITGRRAGFFAAVLSTACGITSIGSRDNPAWLPQVQWIAAGLFFLVMLGLVMLVAALRDSVQRARRLNMELVDRERQSAEREAFLSGVLSSSTDCIKVLDLDGRLTFMTEGGQRVMEVSDFNTIAGCPWPDFWQGAGNAEARAALQAARDGEARSFIGKADTMLGTPRWWHVAVSPIFNAKGRPDRILSVSRDISDLRASEEQRDRFVRMAENSGDFIGMMDKDARVLYMNTAGRRLVGLEEAEAIGREVADFIPPDQMDRIARDVLPAVDRDGHWFGELSFRHIGSGELIPVLSSAFPITDAEGNHIGYGSTTRDYRDLRRAEEDLRLLNGELAHRLKNVLAVVQSIAQQTLRTAPDIQTASSNLGARLVALGAATDVLTGSSWRSADLREVATRALAPHGTIGKRILLNGPAVTLKPEVTVAFALALHELATNAAKYGALSNRNGTVTLDWTVTGQGDDTALSISWREKNGPPVSPPTRKGFGSTLIERSLRSYFKGRTETDYRPGGLVFELEARLGDAAMADE